MSKFEQEKERYRREVSPVNRGGSMLPITPHALPPTDPSLLPTCSIKSIKARLERLPHITHSRAHLRSIPMPPRELPHPIENLAAFHVSTQQSVGIVRQREFKRRRQSGSRRSTHRPTTNSGRAEETRGGDAEGRLHQGATGEGGGAGVAAGRHGETRRSSGGSIGKKGRGGRVA